MLLEWRKIAQLINLSLTQVCHKLSQFHGQKDRHKKSYRRKRRHDIIALRFKMNSMLKRAMFLETDKYYLFTSEMFIVYMIYIIALKCMNLIMYLRKAQKCCDQIIICFNKHLVFIKKGG